jgi:guanyl-specific ribonuclease Sa
MEKKTVTIIVEGTPHEWPKDEKITFEQVVTWVYPDYSPTDGRAYTVTFEKGEDDKREGQLVKGGSVKVKEGMIFNVSRTGES